MGAAAELIIETPPDVAVIAAMAANAEWLCADACAFTLGMLTPKGRINRRGFLERVATRGSFPKPRVLGGEKTWKRSEVLQWADDERRISRAA